jgi:hypothetical protein
MKQQLDSFLEKHPWSKEYYKKKKCFEFIFEFDTTQSFEEIWKILSDTSSFNKLLNLPEIKFSEVDGKKYGEYKMLGINYRWYEVPWEWMYGKYIANERIYEKGIFTYSRVVYEIEQVDENKNRVIIYFGWITKNFLAKTIVKLYKNTLTENFKKGFCKNCCRH